MNTAPVRVSVAIRSYNHERCIRRALDGVLGQRTGFGYEVIVGDDCSSDRTRHILEDYRDRYPDRLRLMLHDHNVGGKVNFLYTLAACHGDYVALLDGDDYWTDENKLQRQVEFLDSRPDYAMCFHRVRLEYDDGSLSGPFPVDLDSRQRFTLRDLMDSNFIPVCSVLYRNGLFPGFPDHMDRHGRVLGDWTHHALVARHGDIGLLDGTMAVYSIHGQSVFTSLADSHQMKWSANTCRLLKDLMDETLHPLLDRSIRRFEHQALTAQHPPQLQNPRPVEGRVVPDPVLHHETGVTQISGVHCRRDTDDPGYALLYHSVPVSGDRAMRVEFDIGLPAPPPADAPVVSVDVYDPGADLVLAHRCFVGAPENAQAMSCRLDFNTGADRRLDLRLYWHGRCDLVARGVRLLESTPDPGNAQR